MLQILAIFLPLAGFLVAGMLAIMPETQARARAAMTVTCGGMLLAALFSIVLFMPFLIAGQDHPTSLAGIDWISSGQLVAEWKLRWDTLTGVMVCVVNIVSAAVHVYSVGYMSHDPKRSRFFAYLSLFTFAMLMLVTADNLVQLFFGWEGVGLASYLLIGFWYEKPSANAAAIKAFLVNRVGDFGFALGIFAVFAIFDTVQFDAIFDAVAPHATQQWHMFGTDFHAISVACLLLFMGAMGKSAQLGLHTWLPDAMEGPTPVSALIHAATMVTAGVFMLARLSPLFEAAPDVLAVVCVVGALTAFVAGTIGLTQFDIKRVIAYSTMSQLGYMFFAIGVSAYGAAIFHLTTHAFFKALLFLGAGSVIHALSDEQDMRRMGGVHNHIPVTYALMLIGSFALIGFPGFAGYFSKDMILEVAWADGSLVGRIAWLLGTLTAAMTGFYSFRLIGMTFNGRAREDEQVQAHIHESPPIMLAPLMVLAAGAIGSGLLLAPWFIGPAAVEFWGDSLVVPMVAGHHGEAMTITERAHHLPALIRFVPVVLACLSALAGWLIYARKPGIAAGFARALGPVYRFVFAKWRFDELYDAIFVRPAIALGAKLFRIGDRMLIDGLGPDGVSRLVRILGGHVARLQSGYVYHYVFAILAGVALFITWALIRGGGLR